MESGVKCRDTVLLMVFICTLSLRLSSSSGAAGPYFQGLSEDFYKQSCPPVRHIVKHHVNQILKRDTTLAGAFIRLQFHDCWVGGCDASVLLNSTEGSPAERDAEVNTGLRGVEEIDEIKAALELVCPRVVSCADIIVLAARFAAHKAGGPKWRVGLGRRDGTVSLASLAQSNLPLPTFNFSALADNFSRKNFSVPEMVTLSGGHTIGEAHCANVSPHLYNFTGGNNVTDRDPAMDAEFALHLQRRCPQGNTTNTVFMDSTPRRFDHDYFKRVESGKGTFISDAALITDPVGERILTEFADAKSVFFTHFAPAMVKMANMQVLTASQGQIRNTCQFLNP